MILLEKVQHKRIFYILNRFCSFCNLMIYLKNIYSISAVFDKYNNRKDIKVLTINEAGCD